MGLVKLIKSLLVLCVFGSWNNSTVNVFVVVVTVKTLRVIL